MSVRFTKREEIAANTPPGMPPGYRLPEHCRKGNNGKPCPYLGFADGLMCQYILITGESRAFHGAAEGTPTGCKPEECTHYLDQMTWTSSADKAETAPEERKPKRKKVDYAPPGLSRTRKAELDARRDRMRIMYEHGLSDQEIAACLGCSHQTVHNWRKRVGIPSQQERNRLKDDAVRQFWEQGLTDRAIAEHLGCGKSTVQRRRKYLGLTPNKKKGEHDDG